MVELAGIIILGILAQWIAWRVRVPAILPLILTGLLVGPLSTLWTPTGAKLLEPIYNAESGAGLFPGRYLFYFVSLAIGIILFEGGLTLKRREVAGVAPVIVKLVTLGSAVTFFGGGLGAHYIMGLNWPMSFQFAGLIIVTGPTVIAPILQNVPLTRNIATVLKWEGILIDPIGALVAVLVYEFIRSADGGMAFTSHALITFFQIILMGVALGGLGAAALAQLIKRELVPPYLLNVFTLAFVLGIFILSDVLAHESGLLTVVVMGMVLGNWDVPRLKDILSFKESISVLLISILFILLAANISLADMELLLRDWRSLGLFAFVSLVLRPLGVLLSTRGSDLMLREKIFISWVGPRGIVAAGIASLFGLNLTQEGVPGAEYLTPLVFMIVLGTVLLNATTARLFARLLGVRQRTSSGILFVGASLAARVLAKYLHDNNRHVVMVDSNEGSVKQASALGLEAFTANVYTDNLADQIELVDMGFLIAMTSNPDVNFYAVKRYRKDFGENGVFRLITAEELKVPLDQRPQQDLLSYTDDFLNLNEVARDYPFVHEAPMNSLEELWAVISRMTFMTRSIPIFVKDSSGEIHIIPPHIEHLHLPPGDFTLVYLGKPLEETAEPAISVPVTPG
ncbi:MAG: sodium:proton antiporter [Lewinellaceae bacterium]|nr:sodium:proton antiporter [Lewinellaceae bacterium]